MIIQVNRSEHFLHSYLSGTDLNNVNHGFDSDYYFESRF